jgi:hypothetical protein
MVRSNRTIANLASAIDSGTTNEFLGLGDSGVLFEPVAYADISNKPTILDSAATIALFDSAYVTARQSGGGIDSAGVTGIIDSAYVQARTAGGGLDSAKMTNLIDSAYITARVTSGLDSAGVTGLVDSSYVTDRFAANSGFDWYLYTATAGQTVFDSIDDNGETLSYSEDGILVFYNGILMLKTYDYTATDGTSITLTTAADSGANVAVVKYGIGSSAAAGTGSPNDEWYGDRGFIAIGGYQGGYTTRIEYVTISTTGNSSDFGDLSTDASQTLGAVTGDTSTRSVFAGGQDAATNTAQNTIQYITTTTLSNSSDFGDLTQASYQNSGFSSGTRGVFILGLDNNVSPAAYLNNIEYVTIATAGNATDFGDTSSAYRSQSAAGDGAVGLVFGGYDGTNRSNHIDKFTISTPGNATDFGDLTQAREQTAACSNQTYAVIGGGYNGSARINVLDYVTIATSGNATDFGDLVSAGAQFAATANGTRGIFGGRFTGVAFTYAIDYITIASPGNASDFGDLLSTTGYFNNSGCSGAAS